MNYKEAIYIIDRMGQLKSEAYYDYLENGGKFDEQFDDEMASLEMAIKVLEKADKYRWHDLRKNPEDLPERDTLIIYAFKAKDKENKKLYYNSRIAGSVDIEIMTMNSNPIFEYIAWKEVEPFEVNDG